MPRLPLRLCNASDTFEEMSQPRDELNAYDLGLPATLAPLEERWRAVPSLVRERLALAKLRVQAALGDRLRELRLFGSYARGDFDEDSDVDVLVVRAGLAPGERERIVDVILGLSDGDAILAPLVLTEERLDELRRRELILAEDSRSGRDPALSSRRPGACSREAPPSRACDVADHRQEATVSPPGDRSRMALRWIR